jgi:hypothetical protein
MYIIAKQKRISINRIYLVSSKAKPHKNSHITLHVRLTGKKCILDLKPLPQIYLNEVNGFKTHSYHGKIDLRWMDPRSFFCAAFPTKSFGGLAGCP